MNSNAKVCRGSWCMAFGFEPPATMEQVAKVLSAFGYDGIELGGFFDHATVERFPDKASRQKLKSWLNDDLGLEIAGIAPGPYGDLFRLPWATGSQEVYDEYIRYFESYLELAADMEIPGMRVDPGAAGPLPYDADYDEVWDRVVRTFQHHAEKGAEVGCVMLWELESLQPFNKPSETVKLLQDVGNDNFKLMYDTGHFQACGVIGHNHVQPAETLPNQIEFIKMLPEGCIGHIHLCDTDMNTHLNMFGTKSNFGEGIIDLRGADACARGGVRRRVVGRRLDPDGLEGVAGHLGRPPVPQQSARPVRPQARWGRGMKAAVFYEPEQIQLEDVPDPSGRGGRGRRPGPRLRILRLRHRVLLREEPARHTGRQGAARPRPRAVRRGRRGRQARRGLWTRGGRPGVGQPGPELQCL